MAAILFTFVLIKAFQKPASSRKCRLDRAGLVSYGERVGSLLNALNAIEYRKIIWVLALSETVHNIEEAIWLPDWSRIAGTWHPPVSAFEFRFAVILITLAIFGIIYYFSKHANKTADCLMGGTVIVILVNIFVPHLAAAIVTARYAPGVISGLALNLPVTAYLLWRGRREGIFTFKKLAIGTIACVALLLPLMAASFALGRAIEILCRHS